MLIIPIIFILDIQVCQVVAIRQQPNGLQDEQLQMTQQSKQLLVQEAIHHVELTVQLYCFPLSKHIQIRYNLIYLIILIKKPPKSVSL